MESLSVIRNPTRVEKTNSNVLQSYSNNLHDIKLSGDTHFLEYHEMSQSARKPPCHPSETISHFSNPNDELLISSKRRSSIASSMSFLSSGSDNGFDDSINDGDFSQTTTDDQSTSSSIQNSSEATHTKKEKTLEDGCLYVLKALYPQSTRKETIIFFASSTDKNIFLESRFKDRKIRKIESHDITFKFSRSVIKYNSIKSIMANSGIKYHYTGKKHGTRKKSDWYIKWGLNQLPKSFSLITKYQVFNHFPGSYVLGRKDTLYQYLEAMRRQFGSQEYPFFPKTWLLPSQKKEFKSIIEEKKSKTMYIMKPSSSCCGRGISIVRTYDQVKKKLNGSNSSWIIQEYISNPLLLNGCKFDLRLYVCVTSYDPLKIYLYNDGLTRISTKKYTNKKDNRFIHLTNFSVQKKGKDFVRNANADADGEGHKWSIPALKNYFKQNGIDDSKMWEDTKDLIIKTIISVESHINLLTKKHMHTKEGMLFELLGFDVLIDANMKPHILEVNCGPSLSLSSPMDKKIKTNLLADIYTMVGVQPLPRKALQKEISNLKGDNRFEQIITKSSNDEPPRRTLAELMKLEKIDALTDEDIHIITETEEELHRRGNFERLFPTKNTWNKYHHLFSCTRYKNLIMHLYLSCSDSRKRMLMERKKGSARRTVQSLPLQPPFPSNEDQKKKIKRVSKVVRRKTFVPRKPSELDLKQSSLPLQTSEHPFHTISNVAPSFHESHSNKRLITKETHKTIQAPQFFINELTFPPYLSKYPGSRSIPHIGIPIH